MWWALSHAFLHTCFPAIRNFKSLARATVVPPATWKKEKMNCCCCFSKQSPQNDVLACLKSPKLIFSEHFNGQHHSFWSVRIWSSLSIFALLLECPPLPQVVGVEESWNWNWNVSEHNYEQLTGVENFPSALHTKETGDYLVSSVRLDGSFTIYDKLIGSILFTSYLLW